MEPSAKWSINMEGALLRHGPSVISSLRVEGWFCLHRTVRDSGLKRGGFGPGEWNLPRFRASAWMVPPNSLFRPTASRKYQRSGILPLVVADRICGQSARARLQYAPHRLLTAERRKRLQIAITAACSLNNMSDCTECSATIPSTRMRESR